MHSYDTEGREKVFATLAILSVVLAWLLHVGLDAIAFEPPWWLSVPSLAGFYSGLYWVFNRFLWKLGLIRKIGIIKIPDLNGEWIGNFESSYSQGTSAQQLSMFISQIWSKIVITLETEHSRSRSVVASLRADDLPNPELSYLYVNEPKSTAPSTMNMHRGTVILEVKVSVLEGDYYTGRGRREIGTIKLHKV